MTLARNNVLFQQRLQRICNGIFSPMSDDIIREGFLLITTAVMIWHSKTFVRISGPKGRRFKSCHLDQFGKSWNVWVSRLFCYALLFEKNHLFTQIHSKSCFCAQNRIIEGFKKGFKPLQNKGLSVLSLWTFRAQTTLNYVLRSACIRLPASMIWLVCLCTYLFIVIWISACPAMAWRVFTSVPVPAA